MRMYITIVTVIVGLIGVFLMGLAVFSSLGASAKLLEDSINQMTAIDAAHVIEHCLKNGGDHVSKSFMDAAEGNMCDICGICEILIDVKVVDLVDNREWKFSYKGFRAFGKAASRAGSWLWDKIKFWEDDENKHQKRDIVVNIDTGKEIHVGRLYVTT
jgi:hypothetical protein